PRRIEVVLRGEMGGLAGDPTPERSRIEARDLPDGRGAGREPGPQAVGPSADRGDGPHPCDHHTTLPVPHSHPPPMRNAECGVRNVTASVVAPSLAQVHDPPLQFRIPHSAFRILPESPHARSASRLIPASVRDAIPWTNTGPITSRAAKGPMTGHAGPPQSCAIVTPTPAGSSTSRQTTSMRCVIPRTCR